MHIYAALYLCLHRENHLPGRIKAAQILRGTVCSLSPNTSIHPILHALSNRFLFQQAQWVAFFLSMFWGQDCRYPAVLMVGKTFCEWPTAAAAAFLRAVQQFFFVLILILQKDCLISQPILSHHPNHDGSMSTFLLSLANTRCTSSCMASPWHQVPTSSIFCRPSAEATNATDLHPQTVPIRTSALDPGISRGRSLAPARGRGLGTLRQTARVNAVRALDA